MYTDTTPFYTRSEYSWALISVGAGVLEPVPCTYFRHQEMTVFCLCSLTEFLSGQLSISDTWSCASSGEKSNLLKCQPCPKHCWHLFSKYEPGSSLRLSYRYWRYKSVCTHQYCKMVPFSPHPLQHLLFEGSYFDSRTYARFVSFWKIKFEFEFYFGNGKP